MAKKSKKSFLAKSGKLLLVLVAVLVAVTMVFPGVIKTFEGADPSIYKGFEIAFGKELAGGSIEGLAGGKTTVYFSIGTVIAFLLPVLGTVLVALLVKNRQIAGVVITLVFIASAVLLFLTPSLTGIKVVVEVLGKETVTTQTFAELKYALGYGSIIGGSLSCVGALLSIGYGFSK